LFFFDEEQSLSKLTENRSPKNMGRQPLTGMDDVERQTIYGDWEIYKKKTISKDCCIGSMATILFVVITLCIVLPIVLLHLDAHYYVAIDSVSELDRTRGLSFNLTLGVSSRNYGTKACIRPGTYVEVSYRGVLLATSEAEVGRLCAGPKSSAEQRVAARTTHVPEVHMLDSLAADMKLGPPLYEVTLHLPPGSYGVAYEVYENWVSGCGRTHVGSAAVWCDAPYQM
jgi:hypothetical protein